MNSYPGCAPPCEDVAVRPTRLIYVENDPALLGIMIGLLGGRPELEVLAASDSAEEVLADRGVVRAADAALIDLALGVHQMNGIDLGLSLRSLNPDIGIILHSQHSLTQVERRIPARHRMGWSTVPKTGNMDVDALVEIIRLTAQGMSTRIPQDADDPEGTELTELSARQRSIMALSCSGVGAAEISRRLGISYDAVRQDLSKCYRVLVPDMRPGDDLRTLALLEYQRQVREHSWDAS